MPKSIESETSNSNADAKRLGREVREVRKARGITLAELSQQVGCSVTYLSRIERGTTKVTVELLNKISHTLMVDTAWFFPTISGDGPLERSHVVRANCRRPLSKMYTRTPAELGFEDELLSSTIDGHCYLLLSRFPAGKGKRLKDKRTYAFEGEQHGFIVSGEVLLVLDNENITLKTGDSFSYPSTVPHRFYNNTEEESVMVWAMAPVRISW